MLLCKFSLHITTNTRHKWTYGNALYLNTPTQFSSPSPFPTQESLPAVSCKLFFFLEEGYKGDPISLHLLIPKSKLVSMRNWEECVSLTFFVECICTSCSSNLKQPTASLIESSPWRLLSGAQVSSKKQHVHMNATNDHMFEGVDPQLVSCDPLAGEKGYK